MKIIWDRQNPPEEAKVVFVDNNILSKIAEKAELQKEFFLGIFEKNYLLVDPLVRLEFLANEDRDDILSKKITFLESEKYVAPITQHEVVHNTYAMAVVIGQLLKYLGCSAGSVVDRVLMANALKYDSYVLTSDKKDFPHQLFVKENVITVEDGRDVCHFFLLRPNKEGIAESIQGLDRKNVGYQKEKKPQKR